MRIAANQGGARTYRLARGPAAGSLYGRMTRISSNAEQTPVSASAPPRSVVSAAAPGIPPGPPQPQSSPSVRLAWRESEPKEDDVPVEPEHLFQQAPPWLFSAAIHMVL